jgi:uncharacterized SAM-binding protein YcdF (DUF218 family)
MVFKLLAPLAQPIGFVWLVLVVLTGWQLRRKQWRVAAAIGAVALLMNLIGSGIVGGPLLKGLERPYAGTGLTNVPSADAVVMLGGAHRPSPPDTFGLDLTPAADRIVTALELMRLGKGQALVLGGNGYGHKGEIRADSQLLKDWFAAWKIPAAPVLDLGMNSNTREEALKVASLMKDKGWKRIILVTSAFHMRRAEATFRKVGIEVIPVGCDFQSYRGEAEDQGLSFAVVPVIDGFQHLGLYIHEQGGWLTYRWRGWVE